MVILYLILVNVCTFVAMGADKRAARKNLYRTPERTLFLMAAIGGAVGGTAGMLLFRHKTKHMKFVAGFPLLAVLQGALMLWLTMGVGIQLW